MDKKDTRIMKTIKRQYTTPAAEIIDFTTEDDLMIFFSLGEGGDDEDEAGAKGQRTIVIEDNFEDDEVIEEDFSFGCKYDLLW